MSPRFVLGRENVPCVAEVVNRSLKADCTDFTLLQTFTDKTLHEQPIYYIQFIWQAFQFGEFMDCSLLIVVTKLFTIE